MNVIHLRHVLHIRSEFFVRSVDSFNNFHPLISIYYFLEELKQEERTSQSEDKSFRFDFSFAILYQIALQNTYVREKHW